MTPVRVMPRAIRYIDEVAEAIALDNLDVALRFYDAVAEIFDLIGRHPLIGSRRAPVGRQFSGDCDRLWVIGFRSYLIFFVPTVSEICVIRVLRGSRDTDSIMGPFF